ncbi:hypothetical protein, partial [Rhizobium sp. PL01]|uniref:hypothetical protein n=1 Tax=Rhizobium sp. PL01 TaxID=3085631 RepID=UPI002981D172
MPIPILTIWTRFRLFGSGVFRRIRLVFAVYKKSVAITAAYQKSDFLSPSVLTSFGVWDYKPLTNEGGGAAGDRRTRSEVSYESLVRIVG